MAPAAAHSGVPHDGATGRQPGRVRNDRMSAAVRARVFLSRTASASYGDRFDLDKLSLVAEDRDAEQGARRIMVTEPGTHHVPGGHEVSLLGARHIHGRPNHVSELGSGSLERYLQVVHHLVGLANNVTWRNDLIFGVDRARAGGVHESGAGRDH